MPIKATDIDFENAIQAYVGGESVEKAAERFHVGYARVSTALKDRGLFRSYREGRRIAALKTGITQRAAKGIPGEEIARRYLAGESENALAEAYGVSRSVIKIRLRVQGVARRSQIEANRLLAEQIPIEEHHRRIKIAQEASRGRKQTLDHRRKIAKSRQANGSGISPTESLLTEWLHARGLSPTPQQAIGPYNVDIGLHPIAVEVLGGAWHASKPTHAKRTRYLLDQGWHVVFVWVHARRSPIREAVADYIIALSQEFRLNPPPLGQYRVIRGDAKELARGEADSDHISPVVPGYESLNASPMN